LNNSKASPSAAVLIHGGRDAALKHSRHPWIYSQGILEVRGEPEAGELLPVVCLDGSTLGWGFYSPHSLIAVRLVTYGGTRPRKNWVEERIQAACALRKALAIDSDALRLVNAEGDFLPGLIVDLYGDTAVVSTHIRGIEVLMDRIVSVLASHPAVKSVFLRRDEHYARVEKLTLPSGYLLGNGDGTRVVREGNLRFLVDFATGQKTGFYLDQRENRRLVAAYARGRSMLNLFSYTGGFSLHAVAGGALRSVSVESSRRAVETSLKNVELNPFLESGSFDWLQEDVFSFLEKTGEYDMIVVDPPPFARKKADSVSALRGYLSLNQRVMSMISSGGFLFSFSCSGAVDRESFRNVLVEAGKRSGREVRFLRELHADADHAVAANHPEGEYLKGWMTHVA
jgi:23S rRNA (cytosine1962-C5)-methyltransferase